MPSSNVATITALIVVSVISIVALVLSAIILAKVTSSTASRQTPATSTAGPTTIPSTASSTTVSGTTTTSTTSTTGKPTTTSTSAATSSTFSTTTPKSPTTSPQIPPGWQAASQMFMASVDRSQDPCEDFYAYACNKWIASHKENTNWFTLTQSLVNQETEEALRAIDDSPTSKADQTLKSLFVGCERNPNDTTTKARKAQQMLNEFGGWPVIDPIWNFDTVPERFKDPSYTIGWLYSRYSISYVLDFRLPRLDDTGIYRAVIADPLTLGLSCVPYDPTNPLWDRQRAAITKLATTLVQVLGIIVDPGQLSKDVDDMITLEQKLCQAYSTQSPTSLSIEQAQKQWPNIHWEKYFDAVIVDLFGYQDIAAEVRTGFYIDNPDFTTTLDQAILPEYTSSPDKFRVLQNYLLWPLAQAILGTQAAHASTASSGHYSGTGFYRKLSEDTGLCLQHALDAAGFAVGQAYIDYKYGDQGMDLRRASLNNMDIGITAFRDMIKQLSWMDDQSKENALIKLDYIWKNAVNQDWAFDDQQLDTYYSYLNNVILDPAYTNAFDMTQAVNQHQLSVNLKKLGVSQNYTDRSAWGNDDCGFCYYYNPVAVNAWYQLARNSMTVPAAILREPWYRPDFPYAVNYGGIFFTIGHEVNHGFNENGQKRDKLGNEGPSWLSPHSHDQYRERVQCLNDQFGQFCYNISGTTMCINASITEEENLADNGGIKGAYEAYMATRPANEPPIPGFEDLSMEQIFFLSFAQSMCERISDQVLQDDLKSASHSPYRDRVIGTLQNFPAFGQAWGCKKGDKMYPSTPCEVW